MEKYIDVKIINSKYEFRNGTVNNEYIDVGIKECTYEDFKNRGNDSKEFSKMSFDTFYCIKNPNLVTIDS